MCPQNIYDDPAFFAGYKQIPRSVEGLDAIYEWPAFQRMLPALRDCRILDLGCGLGYFARHARARGARSVLGVDISQRMLAAAIARGPDPGIRYINAALETFVPPPGQFDLVVSMLALHYIEDYATIVHRVAAALAPGGRFAFSVEHPIYTAAGATDWHRGPDGAAEHWPVDRYRDQGERRTNWIVEGVVKYHRTTETYVNTLIDAGFQLTRLEEPEAESATLLTRRPNLAEERRRPPFLLIGARRHAEGQSTSSATEAKPIGNPAP